MISTIDFEDDTGKIDWNAYHKAQEDAGERCTKCGTYIIRFSRPASGPDMCGECKGFTEDSEASHSSLLRCPKCSNTWKPEDEDEHHVLEEGEHEVTCYECDHTFEISTVVSFDFTSPELTNGEKDD